MDHKTPEEEAGYAAEKRVLLKALEEAPGDGETVAKRGTTKRALDRRTRKARRVRRRAARRRNRCSK